MASIIVWFNDKYEKKDGTCSVNVITYVHRKRVIFNTGVSVHPDKWDAENKKVKGRGAKDANLIIDNCIARVNEVFVRYRLQNRELTPELLRKEYKTPSTYIDFYDFYRKKMEKQKGLLSKSTIKQHKTVIKELERYKKNLMFADITPDWIKSWIKYQKNKKHNGPNTIKKYGNILKGYLTLAVDDGILKENPFKNIPLKSQETDRLYLDPQELDRLWELYNKNVYPDNQQKVLRYYLFSCFTGARISDVRVLTYDHVIGDKLVYQPQKQRSKIVRIPLIPSAKQVIHDAGLSRIKGRLFDTYSEKETNRLLKLIAEGAGIPKKLDFHSSRHTFATNFLRETKNLRALQKMLGHSNIRDTMIYAHILDEDIDSDMARWGSRFK